MSQQQIGGSAATPMCTAGCGFFGSPATLGMCSVCYKKHCCPMTGGGPGAAKATAFDPVARSAATAVTTPGPGAAGSTAAAAKPTVAAASASSICLLTPAKGALVAEAAAVSPHAPEASAAKKAPPGRCAACCKKVGLTGFVCRCGKTFCGSHRYAEDHGCSFDFKAASRDAIARANPVIKAEKLAGKI